MQDSDAVHTRGAHVSVEAEAVILWRPWLYDQVDRGLPSAVWYAQGAVVGDVSGGHAEVVIVLNAAAATRTGRSWSVEVSLPTTTNAADAQFRVNSLNLDFIGQPGQPIQKAFTQLLVADGNLENPVTACLVRDIRPSFYLGAQGAATAAARLQGQFSNVDGKVFGWYAAGFEWAPGAVNAPGGLRRPPGLVF